MKRFWDKVDSSGGPDACWPWTAATYGARRGYGAFRLNGKTIRANRMAWTLSFGPILNELHVLHKCDNTACCNPSHLFLGTNEENILDRVSKNRSRPRRLLSNRQVVEIIVNTGMLTCRGMANVYDVSPSLINYIQLGKKRLPRCAA